MIKFYDDSHTYVNDETGELYISVSGIAKLLEPKVDWNKKLKDNVANLKKYQGIIITPEELKAKWDEKRIKGSGAGTIYHTIREQELLGLEQPNFYDVNCTLKPCSFSGEVKCSLPQQLQSNTVYPEAIIYSDKYKVAGQSDKVIVTDNTIHVEDYKTDKSIERVGYNRKFLGPEKLLAPVSHLDKCNYNIYSIKMSMYMYLLWENNKNFKPGKLILEHVQFLRDEEEIPVLVDGKPVVLKIERIEVPYLRREVRDILEYYKAGKLK